MRFARIVGIPMLVVVAGLAGAQGAQYRWVCCGPAGHHWTSDCHEGSEARRKAWEQYVTHERSHDPTVYYRQAEHTDCSNTTCE